ncbi:hypothetical protein PanWU01x14_365750 [Parasponia andersonii]|uniref:Uncharacterized protein n=1 Tax=Parasponia andersonii TaxID=3476 RepID=A0A2P5A5V9_PARAD|nr:hypothetical protein PanWU01x14_365750 [Parasponia andersonii]
MDYANTGLKDLILTLIWVSKQQHGSLKKVLDVSHDDTRANMEKVPAERNSQS